MSSGDMLKAQLSNNFSFPLRPLQSDRPYLIAVQRALILSI